ncbi:MAG: VWA domain-containing protein [Bryobacterales bacterium]|nr:VWA domain-containing protein [Bryobacterales bacterium]
MSRNLQRTRPATKRTGVALLTTTLAVLVFGPMIGLAIDVGILYLLKARLSQAADAACLAGARSLSRAANIADQRAMAIAVTEKFFDVNFPGGYFGTRNMQRTPTVDETNARLRIVSLTAQVQAPLYFLRLLNHEWADLRVTAEARRRDVNVMMVIDRSGSLETAGACPAVRTAANSFVDKFANGRDRLGLVSFNGASMLDYAPTLNFKDAPALSTKIAAIRCGGWTGMNQALWLGYQQLVNLDERGALNVILLFTDGRPTALTANFPIRTVSDQRYGDGVNLPPNYPSTSTLYNMARSNCASTAAKRGFIAVGNFNARGTTEGLRRHDLYVTTEATIADNAGCAFRTNANSVRRDISYIPATDAYGNSTINQLYKTTERFPAGHPYVGQIRPDSPLALRNAAYNATDNAASRIRADRNLDVTIYVIGLGGTGGTETPDAVLMQRIANTGTQILDPDRPKGLYIYAPTQTQLTDAFLRVASEMLRLAL